MVLDENSGNPLQSKDSIASIRQSRGGIHYLDNVQEATEMSTNRAKVTLQEFSLRPLKNQPRPDQQDVTRVFFSSSALLDLGLKPGSPCLLRKANGEGGVSEKRIGIAWAADKTASLSKSQLQMYLRFKEACGFELEEKLVVEPAESLRQATQVVLMQVDGPELAKEVKEEWIELVNAPLSECIGFLISLLHQHVVGDEFCSSHISRMGTCL